MRKFVVYFLILISSNSFAQKDSLFVEREKELHTLLNNLRAAKNDAEKLEANTRFKNQLFEVIQLDGAFDYPFSKLKSLGSITSPDKEFRLFNWNIENDDESNRFFCFILKKEERSKKMEVIELVDNPFGPPLNTDEVLNEDQWYGALYYKIIPTKKSGKTYYTILGLDPNNAISSKKIIDVLYFSGKHAKLGSSIFKTKKGTQKRIVFEYSKRAVMSLNYDEVHERIIFDHLSPESPGMEDFPEYHVPDMSLDAYKFANNKWNLIEDVVGVNSPQNLGKNEVSYIDEKTGEMKTIKVKNKWIDPSNANAPAGGNTHTAALPENESAQNELDKKNKKALQADKKELRKQNRTWRKKENEFSMTPSISGAGKKRKTKRTK